MKGKLCVVTGATSGIGRATALALGSMGADLVLIGRNETAGRAVISRIKGLAPQAHAEFIRADLSVPDDVRSAASAILRLQRPVDVLVNNAGARNDQFVGTADGHELTFAANHLGHFLLTGLLLASLLSSPGGRIITVTSGSHASAIAEGKWELEEARYDRRQAYAKSKLANVVFAYELARRLSGTRAVSCAFDPGGVASSFARNNGFLSWMKHLVSHARHRELVGPSVAAKGIVNLAATSGFEALNGGYFNRFGRAQSSAPSHDAPLAQSLWILSLASTGLRQNRDVPDLMTKA